MPSSLERREDLIAQAGSGAKQIEAMEAPGFHIGKIDTASLNAMEEFGLSVKNGKNAKGEPGVLLNADGKLKASFEDDNLKRTPLEGTIFVTKGTLELKVMRLKQDLINDPNAPLRIFSYNKDGTVDQVVFEKREAAKPEFDLSSIYPIENITIGSDGKTLNEKFLKSDEALFLKAKRLGIQLEPDGSRSNGISIIDKGGTPLGGVRVFMNKSWKVQLVEELKRLTK